MADIKELNDSGSDDSGLICGSRKLLKNMRFESSMLNKCPFF